LLQLQELARDLTGWPARAVEFRPLVATAASARFSELSGAHAVDLRAGDSLDRAHGPFSDLPRRSDVRRIGSHQTLGRGNLSAVGLFVWRLKVNTILAGEARPFFPPQPSHHHHRHHTDYRLDHYHIDPLGLDRPLFTLADPLPDPTSPAGEMEVPAPIRSRALRDHLDRYYGPDKSLFLWRTKRPGPLDPRPWKPPAAGDDSVIPPGDILVHDLEHWEHSLPPDHPATVDDSCWEGVVIDPTRGRVLYRRKKRDDRALWARYHTAFPADIGGGGYFREVPPAPADTATWVVGGEGSPKSPGRFATFSQALDEWAKRAATATTTPRRVVIEIRDDATHTVAERDDSFREITLLGGEYLEVRAAPHRRPVIRHPGKDDADWTITHPASDSGPAPVFVLDGITLAHTPLRLGGTFGEVQIRHSTLTAGLDAAGALELQAFDGCLLLESSVVCGTIHVRSEDKDDGCDRTTYRTIPPTHPAPILHPPARVTIANSVLNGNWDSADAEEDEDEVIALAGWPIPGADADGADDLTGDHPPGHVALTVLRTTVFGDINVHALDLAEDSIFTAWLRVTDTARGCVRFCSLRTDEPRTPPRHACQPDLAREASARDDSADEPTELAATSAAVAPRFTSTRYGDPAFAQLARDCPREVTGGASDESEMGAFHDLYASYREILLVAGLADSAPADADATILFVN
jgi:hypothetical protein